MDIYIGNAQRQPGLTCPVCLTVIDGMSSVDSEPGPHEPHPGALTFCAYCASLLVFTESFASWRSVSVRPANREEEEWVRNNPVYSKVWNVVKEIRDKRGLGKRSLG